MAMLADPSHTILDAVKSEDRPSSSGSAAPVVLQEHVDDKCIVKDKIPSSDEILDHFWEPMDEDQGGIDSLADYGDGDWASDVQVDAPPIRKREISSGASSPHTSGTTEQLSTHSQQLYDHTWSLDEYGNLKLNKREGTGKDVALEQPKLPPQLQRMMSIDDVDQQQRSNEDDIWDPALEADFSAELDAELDAVFDADIDDDDDMKSVNVTVDLDVNFDTDVDDDDDMRSANVTAELDAGFADEDFGNAVGVEVRDATNVVGHMLPSSPNPAEKEVAARDTTSTGPNSGFGASSTARGVVTSPPASVPTPAGTRSVRKRSDSMGHPASPSTPRTPKRAPSISTFPIPPFPIFSPKRSPFSSPRKQTSFQDPISSPMSPPSKRSLFQYRLPSAPPKSPLAQFGRRTSVASPTPSAPTTPTTKRTSVLDLAVGPRGQSRLVLKASSHVVCKTCGEPLLVCSARPRIKSVQKSMASEMLLNRRRLTAAQDPGSSSTPATTIGGGPALKRTLSDDLANPFLVNPFLVNPFVVKSEIGLATGALPPSQQQHQSMILTLRGTDVLEKLFDQAQNETEEMDCVWRPQDGLFYRRIMCRNCCISTDLTSTSTSTPAPAAATQDLRLIPGWKGVMIVGRSNGQQAAIDESTEEIGMIWLTPGEISVL
ncbi:hypothetical protein EDD21DRAFT_121537 [Dissophora ornata]|nr:hypothetical protein EDD21DRAFT_121537 [Dissophora ornata]